jgi:hypothetical protein
MGFEILDARSEARICMILRTPPILVGAKVGLDRSTFSNYGEARRSYWQDTLSPLFRRVRDELQSDLAPEFGDDVELRWDMSQVPALQEEQTAIWDRALRAFTGSGLTRNEFREMVGKPAIGPTGDVFVMTLNQVETPLKRPAGDRQGAKPVAEDGPDDGQGDEEGKARELKAAAAPDDAERRRHERGVRRAMEGYFSGQLKRIKTKVS